jgi:phenylalanyl-tRNA synthetase beta chain
VFEDKNRLKKFNFPTIQESLELVNPITSELNTLRTTLLINLLYSTQKNIYKSKKSIALFEVGTVFDANRNETKKIAFIYSGDVEDEHILNHGKPDSIDFKEFVKKLKSIFPDIVFEKCTLSNSLIHPYQSANVVYDGKVVGFLSKLHPKVAKEFDLKDTFIAEIDLHNYTPNLKTATEISKFQSSSRDLSLIIDKDITFVRIKNIINSLNIQELKRFYAYDVYSGDNLPENKVSLSVRFVLQSNSDVISEELSNAIMDKILNALKDKIGATLR